MSDTQNDVATNEAETVENNGVVENSLLKGFKSGDSREAVQYLNELLAADPDFVNKLVVNRLLCNKTIADHPTVQVSAHRNSKTTRCGFLGVFNGFFGVYQGSNKTFHGYGPIIAIYERTYIVEFVHLEDYMKMDTGNIKEM